MEGAATQLTAAKPSSNRRRTRNSKKDLKNNDVVGGRGKEQQQQQQQSRVAQDEENRQNGSPDGKRKLTPNSPARAKKNLTLCCFSKSSFVVYCIHILPAI